MVLPSLTHKQIDNMNMTVKKYLWHGRKAKIALDILQNPKHLSGLKLVNFEVKQLSLKISLVNRIIARNDLSYVYYWLIPTVGELIWKVNLKNTDIHKMSVKKSHWSKILEEWCKIHYIDNFVGEEVKEQIIWVNSHIKSGGQPLLNQKAINAGFIYFHHLLDDNGDRMMYDEFVLNFLNVVSWFEYNQLCAAIPRMWWYLATNSLYNTPNNLTVEKIRSKPHCSQIIYNHTIQEKSQNNMFSRFKKYVEQISPNDTLEEHLSNFVKIYKLVKDTKSRNFQYRQLMFCLYPNTTLCKWGVVATEMCEFCNERQTLRHLFWECIHVQSIYKHIISLCTIPISLSFKAIFTCNLSKHNVINQIFLSSKIYLYRCKCMNEKPSVYKMDLIIGRLKRIEQKIAFESRTVEAYNTKWNLIKLEWQ